MTTSHIDLNGFIVAQFEGQSRWIKTATDGLTDAQLHYRPTDDTNSISWLIWHLSRWRDRISSRIVSEDEIWVSGGWAERYGLEADRTGLGDTPEQVGAFQPARDLLLGYADAVHHTLVKRVFGLTQDQFEHPVGYISDERPAWNALVSVLSDSGQHIGQVAYLRGMVTGLGWR